jgi:hypothetical protein
MKRILVLVVVMLLAAACGGPAAPTPDVVTTLVAAELAVAATLTAWVPTAPPPMFTPIPAASTTAVVVTPVAQELVQIATPTAWVSTGSATPTLMSTPFLTPGATMKGEISEWNMLGQMNLGFTGTFGGVSFKLKEQPEMVFNLHLQSWDDAMELGIVLKSPDGWMQFQDMVGWEVEIIHDEAQEANGAIELCCLSESRHLNAGRNA